MLVEVRCARCPGSPILTFVGHRAADQAGGRRIKRLSPGVALEWSVPPWLRELTFDKWVPHPEAEGQFMLEMRDATTAEPRWWFHPLPDHRRAQRTPPSKVDAGRKRHRTTAVENTLEAEILNRHRTRNLRLACRGSCRRTFDVPKGALRESAEKARQLVLPHRGESSAVAVIYF